MASNDGIEGRPPIPQESRLPASDQRSATDQKCTRLFQQVVASQSGGSSPSIGKHNIKQTIDTLSWIKESRITQYISGEQQEQINTTLKTVTDESVHELVAAVQKGDWDDPIFSNPHFPHCALLALMQNSIKENEFFTILSYWEIMSSKGKENITYMPIFNAQGEVDPKAQELIIKTFESPPTSSQFLLSPDKIGIFFKQLKACPPIERVLILRETSVVSSMRVAIIDVSGFNALSCCEEKISGIFSTFQIMVPTASMIEAFVKVSSVDSNTFQPVMVIGLCPTTAFYDPQQRPISFAFPGVPLPSEADGIEVTPIDFSYHDIYHCWVSSRLPLFMRELLIQAAEIIDKMPPPGTEKELDLDLDTEKELDLDTEKELRDRLRDKFLDMDLPGYQSKRPAKEPVIRFLSSIVNRLTLLEPGYKKTYGVILDQIAQKLDFKGLSKEDIFDREVILELEERLSKSFAIDDQLRAYFIKRLVDYHAPK